MFGPHAILLAIFPVFPSIVSSLVAATAPCAPTLLLDQSKSPWTLRPSCNKLDTTYHGVFLSDGQGTAPFPELGSLLPNTTVTPDGIAVPGLETAPNSATLVFIAADNRGQSILGSAQLHAPDGEPTTNANDSRLVVRSARSQCSCGSCQTCPNSPACQPTCQSPAYGSCDFYTQCAEAQLHCGPSGYPIRYGDKNCRAFQKRQGSFSALGRRFLSDTMLCLQQALVGPIAQCTTTCPQLESAAFASHPQCYVAGGFCNLSLGDIMQVVITVNTDLFVGPARRQILDVAKGCLRRIRGDVASEVSKLEGMAAKDETHAPELFAKMKLLEGLESQLLS